MNVIDELNVAIVEARKLPDDECVRTLLELRDRLRAARDERDSLDRSIAAVSNALGLVFHDAEPLQVWEQHLKRPSAVDGRPATVADWEELATVARSVASCAQFISLRAWNEIADTPADGADRRTLIAISRALCAQYTFREREGLLADVRPLQQQRLEVIERISPPDNNELLSCLDDLIQTAEQRGDAQAGQQYRSRRRELRAEIARRS